jgi:signal transduction histidine kinase
MKEFSHPGTTQKSTVDINRALENTVTVSRNTWKHIAKLEVKLDPKLPKVNCHPGEMNQVFLNLIINAAHAIDESGKPKPGKITVETLNFGDFVEVCFSDNGTGVPDAIKDRIFDPFFTTKDVGKGTGQGLAICYDVVVLKHGGQILVGGSNGEGAVFTIRLPVA